MQAELGVVKSLLLARNKAISVKKVPHQIQKGFFLVLSHDLTVDKHINGTAKVSKAKSNNISKSRIMGDIFKMLAPDASLKAIGLSPTVKTRNGRDVFIALLVPDAPLIASNIERRKEEPFTPDVHLTIALYCSGSSKSSLLTKRSFSSISIKREATDRHGGHEGSEGVQRIIVIVVDSQGIFSGFVRNLKTISGCKVANRPFDLVVEEPRNHLRFRDIHTEIPSQHIVLPCPRDRILSNVEIAKEPLVIQRANEPGVVDVEGPFLSQSAKVGLAILEGHFGDFNPLALRGGFTLLHINPTLRRGKR